MSDRPQTSSVSRASGKSGKSETISSQISRFFGVNRDCYDEECEKWERRRGKLAQRKLATAAQKIIDAQRELRKARHRDHFGDDIDMGQHLRQNISVTAQKQMDRPLKPAMTMAFQAFKDAYGFQQRTSTGRVIDPSAPKTMTVLRNVNKEKLSPDTQETVLRAMAQDSAVAFSSKTPSSLGPSVIDLELEFANSNIVDDGFYDIHVGNLTQRFASHWRLPNMVFASDKPSNFEDSSILAISAKAAKPAVRTMTTVGEDEDVPDSSFDSFVDNLLLKEKRMYGIGCIGRVLGRQYNSTVVRAPKVKEQIDEIRDYRTFFTWWVTTVHILVFIVSVSVYGFGPLGIGEKLHKDIIVGKFMTQEVMEWVEPHNMWLGPSQQALIHLGARFSPCMRHDDNVWKVIDEERSIENTTGCCVKSFDNTCVQTNLDNCFLRTSTFKRKSMAANDSVDNTGLSDYYTVGPVCGQDPKFCTEPASYGAFKWPNDLTKWPVCTKEPTSDEKSLPTHMACESPARPCCVGVLGQCVITSREECDFKQGYFHQEARLCSQVNCLEDVCGMIPFARVEKPDQFYRLFTSLFMVPGFFNLLVTVVMQVTIMRDLEKFAGWIRISVIYMVSGVAGNLVSAIFLPYYVEAGPAGSHFALLACLYVEIIQSWPLLDNPWCGLLKISIITFLLFLLGLLPIVDNYAHIVGFVFGLLLSFIFLPYINVGYWSPERKLAAIIVCSLVTVLLLTGLILLFYVFPIYECSWCHYLTCLPITDTFCKYQGIDVPKSF